MCVTHNQNNERVFKPDVGYEEINMTTTITTNVSSNTTTTHNLREYGGCTTHISGYIFSEIF